MMKKNLKLFASALGFIFLFYSCRTDEMVNSEQRTQNEKIGAFERFENQRSQEILNKKTHSSKSGVPLPLSYSQPFSEIIYQFLVNHPDFYDKLSEDFGEIDYNVASQTFGEEKKYIFYPILKDGKVTSLWYGKLNEDRSWVDFYLVHDTSASTQRMIGEFQNYYSKKMASRGEPDPPVIEIPEIIINPPSTNPPIHDPIPGTGGDGTYTPPYTGDMSGGAIMHGGGTGTSTTQDPCKKIKEKQSNLKYATKFDSLNKKKIFDMDKERGYYELQPPKGIGAESGFVQVDGPSGSTGLDLPDNTDRISGLFHSHNNVDGSVKIFSPTDVKTFINTFLKNAREYAGSYSDAYSTVITSEGSYTLKYTKSTHPGGINYDTSKVWNEWYKREMDKIIDEDGNLPQNKVEEVFTQFLNEVVNIDGLEVYKVTANSAIRITYNSNTKQVNSVPCP